MATPEVWTEATFGRIEEAVVGTGRQRDFWVLGKDLFLDLAGGDKGACFIITKCRG